MTISQVKRRKIKAKASPGALLTLRILESFGASNPRQSLAEISRRLTVPKATALRTLRALEEMRYVAYNIDDSEYSLSVGVMGLAQRFLSRFETLAVVRPILADLASQTGETAHYGVLHGTEVVYLEISESLQRIRAYVLRGDHIPAHCVAAGKVILAYSAPHILEAVMAAGLRSMTPASITEPNLLLNDLRSIRQRGFGINVEEWMSGVTGISAPVFGHSGDIEGAIGISGPSSRMSASSLRDLGTIVREHAERLSQTLNSSAEGSVRGATSAGSKK